MVKNMKYKYVIVEELLVSLTMWLAGWSIFYAER